MAARGLILWAIDSLGNPVKVLADSDGTLRVDGTATISGTVSVSNLLNPHPVSLASIPNPSNLDVLLSSRLKIADFTLTQELGKVGIILTAGGAIIDPRLIRALTSSDIVTAYGSQTQALLQRATTYDLIVQLRSAGVEIDPRSIRALAKATDEVYSVLRTDAGVAYDARDRSWTITENLNRSWNLSASDVPDLSDKATRLLGVIYGSQGQKLLQRASTYESVIQLSHQGSEYDAKQIRALTSSDVVDVVDKATRLLGVVYGSQGQQLLQRATTYDLLVQLRTAGIEYDSRQIRALTNVDVVTAQQATRTSLLMKPEREDLLLKDFAFTTSVDLQPLLSAVASQKHKVYAYGYEADADGTYYFSATVNGAEWKFGRRITKGLIVQTFVHPIVCDVNTALNYMCTTGNAKTWIQYKTEA